MRPATYDLDLYRGDTYAWAFKLWTDNSHTTPVDLTGVNAKAELRAKSGATPVAAMTCTIQMPNTVNVRLPVAAWANVAYSEGRWDLQLTYPAPGNDIITIVAGDVTITPDITDSTALTARANGRTDRPEDALPLIGGPR